MPARRPSSRAGKWLHRLSPPHQQAGVWALQTQTHKQNVEYLYVEFANCATLVQGEAAAGIIPAELWLITPEW